MFNKKKRMLKLAKELRVFAEKEDNYGLLFKKLNSLRCVTGGGVNRLGYVFVDLTMDDGYTISASECFESDALQTAMKNVADRLEERYG